MSKNKKLSSDKYFNLPNPGLRSYFDKVLKGNDEIYHTPWIQDGSNESILKQLDQIVQDWVNYLEPIKEQWPSLYDFENELAAKVGPLSIQEPLSQRMDDIEAYYNDIHLSAVPLSEEAIKATLAKFSRVRGLRLRSQQRTLDLMKKSTNSGNPFFQKRRSVVKKTMPCTVFTDSQILDGTEWGTTAILGWRGQEGGLSEADVKQRVVWMFPFAVNIEELRVYQPLTEAAQRFNLVPAWVSSESVDSAITKLFDTKNPKDLVICTDFTKFDQHFNPTLQEAGSEIFSRLLTNDDDSQRWLQTIYPIKYQIPLALQLNDIREGKHGMGSGSGGTNADETLVHTALQYEAAISQAATLNPNSMCLGDDGVLTYPGITEEDVMHAYTKHGLEMNASKQYSSTQDCVYLRRWHHKDYRVDGVCVGVYSTCRALGRLCMQERFYDPDVWGPKMVALRELSIIENCKYHPLKEEFADYCMKRDKYRLGLDIPGFLDNIESEAKKAIDYMPDFLGYTRSQMKSADTGIQNWWIVKYLKSKA